MKFTMKKIDFISLYWGEKSVSKILLIIGGFLLAAALVATIVGRQEKRVTSLPSLSPDSVSSIHLKAEGAAIIHVEHGEKIKVSVTTIPEGETFYGEIGEESYIEVIDSFNALFSKAEPCRALRVHSTVWTVKITQQDGSETELSTNGPVWINGNSYCFEGFDPFEPIGKLLQISRQILQSNRL